MTPQEIIALARAQFGEANALTVTATTARDFLNAAIKETYEDLPPSRLKNLISETTVTLTAGKGSVLATWDKILEVYADNIPCMMVSREVIHQHDYSQFFASPTPICHIDDKNVWVRPTTSTCKVLTLSIPTEVTSGNEGTEYTGLDKVWHPALADLVTAAMYAQEEDAAQADQYRKAYQSKLGMLLAPEPAE